jgi:hypothetical protein
VKTTIRVPDENEPRKVAVLGDNGEWIEIGYVDDMHFSIEWEEFGPWPTNGFKTLKTYSMTIDLTANPAAHDLVVEILRQHRLTRG